MILEYFVILIVWISAGTLVPPQTEIWGSVWSLLQLLFDHLDAVNLWSYDSVTQTYEFVENTKGEFYPWGYLQKMYYWGLPDKLIQSE